MMNDYEVEAERQFRLLVTEMRPLGYRTSAQVSRYIITHKLGMKYKYISGHLDFQNGENTWTFKGGISPTYYARLCEALDLGNNGSKAEWTKFVPFSRLAG